MTLHRLVQVEAYAQQFRFLQLEHDEVSQRLSRLERLFKQHVCTTSEQLLEATAKAESSLDQWFQMEGGLTLWLRTTPSGDCHFLLGYPERSRLLAEEYVLSSGLPCLSGKEHSICATMTDCSARTLQCTPCVQANVTRVLHCKLCSFLGACLAMVCRANTLMRSSLVQATEGRCKQGRGSSRLRWRRRRCS